MYRQELVGELQSVAMIDDTLYEWQTLVATLIGPVIREVGYPWPAVTEPLHRVSLCGELSDLLFLSYDRPFLPRFEKMPLGLKEQAVRDVVAFLSVSARKTVVDAYRASNESVPIELLTAYLASRFRELRVYLRRNDSSATFAKETRNIGHRSAVHLRLRAPLDWEWQEFQLASGSQGGRRAQAELQSASKGTCVILRSVSDRRPSLDEVIALRA